MPQIAQVAQVLVRFDGVFDVAAAERVAEALAVVKPGGALRLDLTQVREFHDAGVAALARTLAATGDAVRVVVAGLRQHQLRILTYLGVDVLALAAPLPA
jgi:anti-anti-sigma regulatory factor